MNTLTSRKLSLSITPILKRPWLIVSMALSVICILVMMFTFRYGDMRAYQAWTLEFLDCLFGKTDVEFYQYTAMDLRESLMPMPCDHSILTLIPIIIWNIPLWVHHEITGVMSAGCHIDMVWLKIGLVVCLFFVALEVYRIVNKVHPTEYSLLAFPLIFMSGDFMVSTMYCGQDEVVYILFLVMALRHLIYNNKWRFLLCATAAVSLNPLTLLPVLLMVVYREKRVLFIILDVVITLVPNALFEYLYRDNSIYQNAVVVNGGAMKTLFTSGVTLGQDIGRVPLLFVLFGVLVFLSYASSYEEKNHFITLKIVAAMTMGQILLSTGSYIDYFYRSPLYVPFLAAMVLCSGKDLRTNLILYGFYTSFQNWIELCDDNNLTTFNLEISNSIVTKNYLNYGCLILNKYVGDHVPALLNRGLITAICLSLAIILFIFNSSRFKDVTITKLSADKLTVVISLYMPLILGIFFGMWIDYAYVKAYQKQIFFGNEYLEQTLSYANFNYITYNGMHTYSNKIVYENGVCLINGEDENGIRTIHQDGISFGPYTTLYEGVYQITICGENLEEIGVTCTYSEEDVISNIDIRDAELSYSQATYQIVIDERVDNVEFGVFNSTSDDVILTSINIQEIKGE